MKLVIGGSTGLVGTELTRQALLHTAVTSVVALSRRETPVPADAGSSSVKLTSVICDDFESYSDTVKKELQDADACIWTIAVTPSKLKSMPFEDISKICRDYAVTAIKTLDGLRPNQKQPLRFIYMSGHFAPRSAAEVPKELIDNDLASYGLLRGEAESNILAYAEQSNGAVQACVAKPGIIDSPGREKRTVPGVPNIELCDISAALLDQVVNGFEKKALSNEDMIKAGRKALAKQKKL
ncbi:hypothetical protein F4775DRAFT_608201 [Biscogniauxia sp. FL1348]|nr:hypothetical protein F4775DRAFT_608201 [Biscogniauxia sp. FL1348]